MSRQFENSEDSWNSEDLSCFSNGFQGVLGREDVEGKRYIEGKYAKKIDDVQKWNEEIQLQIFLKYNTTGRNKSILARQRFGYL